MTISRVIIAVVALSASMPAGAWADPSAAMAPTPPAASTTAPAAKPAPGKSGHIEAATPDISCPGDVVVWVNPRSKAYHLAGDRFFGHTRHGKFICKKAADAAGDHPVPAGR